VSHLTKFCYDCLDVVIKEEEAPPPIHGRPLLAVADVQRPVVAGRPANTSRPVSVQLDVPPPAMEDVPVPPPENMWPEGLQEYVVDSLLFPEQHEKERQQQMEQDAYVHARQCERVDRYIEEQQRKKEEEERQKQMEHDAFVHARQCERVDRYIEEQQRKKEEEERQLQQDELRRKDAENREADQAVFQLQVQRARQEREDEHWRHEQQQQQQERQRLMREKEQRARIEEQAEFERLQQKRAREAAKEQETVERLGKRTYLREDLKQAHLSGKRWAEEQAEKKRREQEHERYWQKRLEEEARLVREEKRMRAENLAYRRSLLEDELLNIQYIVKLNDVEKEMRKKEIAQEVSSLQLQEEEIRRELLD
jgi:hypothetical protein